MPKRIRNMGTSTMRFNEGIVVSGSIDTSYASQDGVAIVCTGSVEISGNGTNDEVLRVITNNQQKDIVFVTQGSQGTAAQAAFLNGNGSGGLRLQDPYVAPSHNNEFRINDGSLFTYKLVTDVEAENNPNSKLVLIEISADFTTMRDRIIGAINASGVVIFDGSNGSTAVVRYHNNVSSNRADVTAIANSSFNGGINLTATVAGASGNNFQFFSNTNTISVTVGSNQAFGGGADAVNSVTQAVKGSVYLDTAADLNISGSLSTVLVAGEGDFVLFPSNSVGIGTTSPTTALEVAGEITVDDSTTEGSSIVYGDGKIHLQHARDLSYSEPAIKFERSRGTQSSPAVSQLDDDLGSISWTSWDGSSEYRTAAQIQAEADGAHGGGLDTPARIMFRTAADGSSTLTDRMTIKSTGNVGIGTITPSTTLEVAGEITANDSGTDGSSSISGDGQISLEKYSDSPHVNPQIFLQRARGTDSSPTNTQLDNELGSITWFGYNATPSKFKNSAEIRAIADGNHGDSATDSPGRIEFLTTPDGSETLETRMTIKSTGKVGIGTNNPAEVLHVYANASNDFAAFIENDQSTNGHALKVSSDGTGPGAHILELESASTTFFIARGDQKIGIGKVASLPDAKLTVSSSNTDSDIAIAHKIHHIADPDTSIQFPADDQISLEAGGIEFLKVVKESSTPHIISFNESGNDVDVHFKDNSNQDLLVLDASDSQVGFGTSPNEIITASGSISLLELDTATIPGHTSDYGKIYAKASDSKLYFKNDSGTEYDLTAGNASPTPAGSNNHVQYNSAGSLAGSARFQFFHGATDKNFLMGGPSGVVASNAAKLSIATEIGVDCQGENNPGKYALMVNGFKDNGSGGIDVVDTEGGVGIGFSRNYSDVGASIVHDSYVSSTGNFSRGSLKFFNKNENTSGTALTECLEIVGSRSGLVRAKAGTEVDATAGISGIFAVGDSTVISGGSRKLEFDKRTIQAKDSEGFQPIQEASSAKTLGTLYLNKYGGRVSIGYDGVTQHPTPNAMLRVASASIYENVVNVNRYVGDFRHLTHDAGTNGGDAQHAGIRIQCGQYAASADDSVLWINFFDGDANASQGRIAYKNGVGAYLWNSSDERIKTDIQPTTVSGLSLLNQINLKSFKKVHTSGVTGSMNPIGFVAQDVENSIPELVSEYNDEAYDFKVKSLGYAGFVPYLVKAVQELTEKNEQLEARIRTLEG